MGVYIPGMEMPKNCSECGQFRWSNLLQSEVCRIAEAIRDDGIFRSASEGIDNRPAWCPLVPVPEHGRLGDLDELEKLFLNAGENHKGIGGLMTGMAALCVREMPTIIPASKE